MTVVVKRKEIEEKFPKIKFPEKSIQFEFTLNKQNVYGAIAPISISLLGYAPKSLEWFLQEYQIKSPDIEKVKDPKDAELLWKAFYFQNEEKIKEAKENYFFINSYDAELIIKQLEYKFII